MSGQYSLAPILPTWLLVHETTAQQTERMRVVGGWLYRTTWFSSNGASAVAMVFQPERAE
jgi:hypothetical protein